VVPGTLALHGLRCGELSVDVLAELDLERVAETDAYADTVDIAALAETLREVLLGPPRLLLETMAVHAARLVLERYPLVQEVRLRVAKSEPAGLDAAEEAVSVRLVRDSAR
jgi:dihydroneopterin aldolase